MRMGGSQKARLAAPGEALGPRHVPARCHRGLRWTQRAEERADGVDEAASAFLAARMPGVFDGH
jgi:hypothetical protein